MRKLVLGAVALMFSTGLAFAADPMAGVIGNTVVGKSAAGVTKYWYKADHTYTAVDAKGAKMSGTWEDKDGKLCLAQTSPTPSKLCADSMAGKKVGDTWETTASDGTKYSGSIVAGM